MCAHARAICGWNQLKVDSVKFYPCEGLLAGKHHVIIAHTAIQIAPSNPFDTSYSCNVLKFFVRKRATLRFLAPTIALLVI